MGTDHFVPLELSSEVDDDTLPFTVHVEISMATGIPQCRSLRFLKSAWTDKFLSPPRGMSACPKIEWKEPTALTVEEVVRLAGAIDPRYRALVLVGAFGGLRIGELAGLQVRDFDPHQNLIRIRRTVSDVQGRLIVGPPKTPKSIRTVALPGSIAVEMHRHLTRLEDSRPDSWTFPAQAD